MFEDLIRKNSLYYNVPEVWIKAVIQTESAFDPQAYRPEPRIQDASYGLMQLLISTSRSLGYTGTPEGLYNPNTNIGLGTRYLANLRSQYGDDIRRVYSAYNSGSPDRWTTSEQVRLNVERLLRNLKKFLDEEPLVVTGSVAGTLILLALLWFWKK